MGKILSSKEIGEKLKEFRKRKGLTQEQLAEKPESLFSRFNYMKTVKPV